MSTPDNGTTRAGSVKTLAIRLEADLHAELTLIAQLREQTVTDEIREALLTHIASVKQNPAWASKADAVLADIERQAAARRDAFARLFGSEPTSQPAEVVDTTAAEPASAAPTRSSRSRKGTSDTPQG
jgi:hypothetical protein